MTRFISLYRESKLINIFLYQRYYINMQHLLLEQKELI